MTVTVDTVLVQDSEPIPATVDEDVVLLSIRSGNYYGFNRVGTEIWQMLNEPRRVGDILDTLATTHDVDRETMTRDVMAFLQNLIDRGLVKVTAPGNSP